jgi:hypothetical protein
VVGFAALSRRPHACVQTRTHIRRPERTWFELIVKNAHQTRKIFCCGFSSLYERRCRFCVVLQTGPSRPVSPSSSHLTGWMEEWSLDLTVRDLTRVASWHVWDKQRAVLRRELLAAQPPNAPGKI